MLVVGLLVSSVPRWAVPPNAIPVNANAAVAIDLVELLKSRIAVKNSWKSVTIRGDANKPLPIPPYATEVLASALITPSTMEPMCQLSLSDRPAPTDLEKIAVAQKGFLEELAGRQAVWTPRGVCYIQVNEKLLMTAYPAQRQLLVKLIESSGQLPRDAVLPMLLGQAEGQIRIAMDLEDALSLGQVHYAMSIGGFPSLDRYQQSLPELFHPLSTVKSLRPGIVAAEDFIGNVVVKFAKAPAIPAAMVKGFLLDALIEAGVNSQEFESWEFRLDGKRLTGTGKISIHQAGEIVRTFITAPDDEAGDRAIAAATEATGVVKPPEPLDPKQAAAEASKAYFQAISRMLDAAKGGASMQQSAQNLRNMSRRIQQLPILNVDPELVAWGGNVSIAMTQAATVLAGGQVRAQNAVSAVASPTAYAGWSDSGYNYADTSESRAAFRNAPKQRRAAAQGVPAESGQQVMQIKTEATASRNEIRAKMVQKFGIEF